jgi:hypothetical protein
MPKKYYIKIGKGHEEEVDLKDYLAYEIRGNFHSSREGEPACACFTFEEMVDGEWVTLAGDIREDKDGVGKKETLH